MQIIVFGATGKAGQELVKQAVYKGYDVKAFGRNVFTANLPQDEHLELVQGALFDEGQVLKAIKGCDAVIAILGGDSSGADVARSLGMKNIVAQMNKAAVHRIIAVGTVGNLDTVEGSLIMDEPEFPAADYQVSKEHLKALQYLKSSALDWTFVCPPVIIDAGPTGEFVTASDQQPVPAQERINAGDLALFILNELERNEYVQHRVGISATR